MRVQEVLLDEDNKRYILIDGDGMPVIEAIRYLKYLDSVGRSWYVNTKLDKFFKVFKFIINWTHITKCSMNSNVIKPVNIVM